MPDGRAPASFRDPSGTVFWHQGELYRSVTKSYEKEFVAANESGLYDRLAGRGLLIPHEAAGIELPGQPDVIAVLRPQKVPFISYPYEWCFGQLKDAALTTLAVQKAAMDLGFTLKDASAYNVQFLDAKPVFIDTLSFERLEEGQPWVAYKQFCQHFLAPLLLMAKTDVDLGQLSRLYVDGVPLELASRLLPRKTRWSPWIAAHIHLHAKTQSQTGPDDERAKAAKVSATGLRALVENLEAIVKRLDWTPQGTTWGQYYSETNYPEEAMSAKKETVAQWLSGIEPKPSSVWDLGANNGEFARLATAQSVRTVAWDVDPAAVEQNYRLTRERGDAHMLPLLQDLTNPSPDQGWAHEERQSLERRGPADVVMALALVHHLAIGNNVPLAEVARYFARLGRWLIVEFVPKEDSQVARMLACRKDVFPGYCLAGFEESFAGCYEVRARKDRADCSRTLFLMRSRHLA